MRTSDYGSSRAVLYAVASAGVALAILILSVIPPLLQEYGGPSNSGPWAHIIAYATLCISIYMWLHVAGTTRAPALYAALVSASYGFLIECLQYVLPYRSFELSDILVNCGSACAAAIVAHGIFVLLFQR